jgi:ketosteroid isomerase-like protein
MSNLPLVERFWAANATGDVDTLKAVLAPDVEWTVVGRTVPIAKTYHGQDEFFGELIATLIASFTPGTVQMTVTGMFEDLERSTVVTQVHERAESVTGATFDNDIVTVMTIADGRIAAAAEYMDLLEVSRSIPAPTEALQ